MANILLSRRDGVAFQNLYASNRSSQLAMTCCSCCAELSDLLVAVDPKIRMPRKIKELRSHLLIGQQRTNSIQQPLCIFTFTATINGVYVRNQRTILTALTMAKSNDGSMTDK